MAHMRGPKPAATAAAATLSVGQWIHDLDTAIVDEVTRAHPFAWDEDHITFSWISRLMRQFRTVTVIDGRQLFSVAWQAFKAKGSLEQAIGDIAFVVRFHFPRKSSLVGIGLLEAKRIAIDRAVYSELNWKQLERQSAGRSNHRVLLYDYASCAMRHNLVGQLCCEHLEPACFPVGHVSSIPTAHVLAVRTRRRALADRGLPLAFQIGVRYLRGFDLEYDRELVTAVLRDSPALAHYVIVADVSGGTAAPPSNERLPSVSPKVFRRLPKISPHGERLFAVTKESVHRLTDQAKPRQIAGMLRGDVGRHGFDPLTFRSNSPSVHSRFGATPSECTDDDESFGSRKKGDG